MQIFIITLLPEMFTDVFAASILKRAQKIHKVEIKIVNLRDFAADKYKTVDDRPYGGGTGMILKVDVMERALTKLKSQIPNPKIKTILLDPQGTKYSQIKARGLSNEESLILICGHYEGVDERIRRLVDEEISIGDYIMSGGEIPAMILVDSIVRLIPGVLKKSGVTDEESFSGEKAILEYPQYTRPEVYNEWRVPEILLSGNHRAIKKWQEAQAIERTKKRRGDLLARQKLRI